MARQAAAADVIDPRLKEMPQNRDRPDTYSGACFVVKDNIDTDQIIPAEYLTLVPSKVRALSCFVWKCLGAVFRAIEQGCLCHVCVCAVGCSLANIVVGALQFLTYYCMMSSALKALPTTESKSDVTQGRALDDTPL